MSNARRVKKIAKEVAEKTGGDVLTASSEKELEIVFLRLTKELPGAYRLTYEPLLEEPNPKLPQIQTTRRNVDLLFPRN